MESDFQFGALMPSAVSPASDFAWRITMGSREKGINWLMTFGYQQMGLDFFLKDVCYLVES